MSVAGGGPRELEEGVCTWMWKARATLEKAVVMDTESAKMKKMMMMMMRKG